MRVAGLRWLAAVCGLCLVAVFVAISVAPWLLEVKSTLPCVRRDQQPELVEVHFAPGLVEHQSWITFRGLNPNATFIELCLDGMQVAVAPHEMSGDTVQYNLRTTFVDALWLTHRLEDYRQPSHWELYWYVCGQKPDDPHGCY